MEEILQLDPMPGPGGNLEGAKSQTPKDVGEGLFKDVLAELSRSSRDKKQSSDQDKKDLEGTLGGLEDLAIPLGQLRLPEQAMPRLIKYLENQGLGREKINQMIQSAKGPEGFIHLDRLMASLKNMGLGVAGLNHELVIPSRDIPKLEEILFRLGAGVGEVKEIIERSMNREGDVVTGRLSNALGRFFKDPSKGGEMISMLRQFGIETRPGSIEGGLTDVDLKRALTRYSNTSSRDHQKIIKQNIAGLLREKGIPPQEIKSFLETMNVSYAKSLLKKFEAIEGASLKGRLEAESVDLLNRVVIRSQPDWQKGGWQEKILNILKEESFVKVKYGSQGNLQGKEGIEGQINMSRTERTHFEPGSVTGENRSQGLPHPLPKIMDRMMWMIRSGVQRGRIHISPPELGRLDLDLVIKQGHLQANVSAESQVVKELIEANLNQLRQQLTDQGLVVDRFEVMVGLEERQNQAGNERMAGGRRDRSHKRSDKIKGGPEPEMVHHRPIRSGLHEIDVHV